MHQDIAHKICKVLMVLKLNVFSDLFGLNFPKFVCDGLQIQNLSFIEHWNFNFVSLAEDVVLCNVF